MNKEMEEERERECTLSIAQGNTYTQTLIYCGKHNETVSSNAQIIGKRVAGARNKLADVYEILVITFLRKLELSVKCMNTFVLRSCQ